MNYLSLQVQTKPQVAERQRLLTITLDADRLEALAARLGLLSEECERSLQRAERDIRYKRYKKISSLSDLM